MSEPKCVCEFPDSFYDACFAEFELLRGHDYDAHLSRRKAVACTCQPIHNNPDHNTVKGVGG